MESSLLFSIVYNVQSALELGGLRSRMAGRIVKIVTNLMAETAKMLTVDGLD